MNTIEFAIEDGVPYAIDYLNPAPDFERDRITPFYFSHVVEKMTALVIDRALNGEPSQSGRAGRRCSASAARVRVRRRPGPALTWTTRSRRGTRCCGPDVELSPGRACGSAARNARAEADLRRSRRTARSCARSCSPSARRGADPRRRRDDCRPRRTGRRTPRMASPTLFDALGMIGGGGARSSGIDPGYATSPARRRGWTLSCCPIRLHFAEYNAESPAGPAYTAAARRDVRRAAGDGAIPRRPQRCGITGRSTPLLAALLASYARLGRPRRAAARSPSSTGARCRPGPSSRSSPRRLPRAGVPTLISDPRDLEFDGRTLDGRRAADRPGLSPGADQRHRGARRTSAARWSTAYRAGAVCVANTFRCKLAHKKAFFAVLTDERHADRSSAPRTRPRFARTFRGPG